MAVNHPVVIVGGGAAGLSAARTLHKQGIPFRLFEASPQLGGRLATRVVDGFRIDRGFQVLLTAYPEVANWITDPTLALKPYCSGMAILGQAGNDTPTAHYLADPRRHPSDALASALAPYGTPWDRVRLVRLIVDRFIESDPLESFFPDSPLLQLSTLAWLQQLGFSLGFIHHVLRPFLAGILLDPDLATSAAMAAFVLRMMAAGQTTTPALGMGELARVLAAPLPAKALHCQSPVVAAEQDAVTLADGTRVDAAAVIVATPWAKARQLMVHDIPRPKTARDLACTTLAIGLPSPSADVKNTPLSRALQSPWLMLNGMGSGHLVSNHAVMLSAASPALAPAGQALLSVTVLDPHAQSLDDEALFLAIQKEWRPWLFTQADHWRLLVVDRIPQALSWLAPGTVPEMITAHNGVVFCGDWLAYPSLNGALASGRMAAEAVVGALSLR